MTNSNWSRWWKPSSNSRGSGRKRFWPTAGIVRRENLAYLESADQPERKIDGFIATGKQKHGEHRLPCTRGPLPKGATRVDRMKRKLQTKVGKAVYAARKCVVEPVFGQIKQARGFRQFLLRGKDKVKGEWALVCLTHNILKLLPALQRVTAAGTRCKTTGRSLLSAFFSVFSTPTTPGQIFESQRHYVASYIESS